jgi:glycyl-tRNA synthetase beta chain
MTDFLLELRSEEIPARMQDKARLDLEALFVAEMAEAGIENVKITTYATPRRLVLIAKDLPTETLGMSEERKGPRADAPEAALQGFLRSTGLKVEQLVSREDAKGAKIWFAVIEKPGRATADVLAEAIPAIVRAFPWPKSMRWGTTSVSTESLRWVRPLQGIVALLGDKVVPCAVDGVESGAATVGHRFHHSGPVTVGNAGDYAAKLNACHVIVDQEERRAIIRTGAERCAADAVLVLVPDEGLVVENAGLTEWPVPMLGRFDPAFLDVPEEVIQLTARVNQKYFICRDKVGKLANSFVCTANITANDGGAAIVAGNEKVLAARLSDAKFFWDQDIKIKLDVQREKLKDIVFHEKLGTVWDKVERVAKLSRWLVTSGVITPSVIPAKAGTHKHDGADTGTNADVAMPMGPGLRRDDEVEALADQAERAARLCKADLVTGMVGEFPELQGVMGGYYARAQGETDAVADAVRDHYKPVGQGDDVPTAPVTVAVSLADKLDTLVSFFYADMSPTGSKDPFALRRAALGVIELLVHNKLRLPLFESTNRSLAGMTSQVCSPGMLDAKFADHEAGIKRTFSTLPDFFADRLKVQQREAGVRHDLIDAVFALGGEDDLVCLLARVKALQAFVTTDEGANLLAAYKRAANILKQADGTDTSRYPELVSGSMPPSRSDGEEEWMLKQVQHDGIGVEASLRTALDAAEPKATAAIEAEDFEGAMAALASLRAPIDAFFEGVMVNDPDPQKRAFRLGLLARFRDAVHRVADFSRIEG